MCTLQQNNRSTTRWTEIENHIINKLLTTIGDLTSEELKLKDNIIHKLINKNNCQENISRTSITRSSTKITSDITQSIDDSDKNSSINAIKEQVATIKESSTSVKSNNPKKWKIKELYQQS